MDNDVDVDNNFTIGMMFKKLNRQGWAIRYLEIVAQYGHIKAQYNLAKIYYEDDKSYTDKSLALKWFKRAAEQGHPESQNYLGDMYKFKQGITRRDFKKAVKWYKSAADQGHVVAQTNLGDMYMGGRGVKTQIRKARKLYRKSASQGDSDAEYNLGIMYHYGCFEVKKNRVESLKWFLKAASNDDSWAKMYLRNNYSYK